MKRVLGVIFCWLLVFAAVDKSVTATSTSATPSATSMPHGYSSGILTFVFPAMDRSLKYPYEIRFSAVGVEFAKIGQIGTPDLIFDNGFIAPYGIVDIGQTMLGYITCNGSVVDPLTTPCYEAYFPEHFIIAPENGYVSKLGFSSFWQEAIHIYILKTAQGKYVALLPMGYTIGGYDREYFFWMYNDNGSRLFPPDAKLVF